MNEYETIVIGGGAAGFFCASSISKGKTLLLEKSLKVLSKVLISGGGRCNVTHSCFDPKTLASHYPRGSSELLGVFSRFQPRDTINWFGKRGVELKTEEDGRMFPITDSSETIIWCLTKAANDAGVDLKKGAKIQEIKKEGEWFFVKTETALFRSKNLVLATGSSPQGHEWAVSFGHTITPLAPSLFTFNIPTSPLLELSGISLSKATVSVMGTKLKETGPLLLTHFGFSGPAILRLSAWGARELNEKNYKATVKIDWTAGISREELKNKILELKKEKSASQFTLETLVDLPKNLSRKLYPHTKRFAELSNKDIESILDILTASLYTLDGKTTYKSEFVTCGGVNRKEVDFKTMESRLCKGLYFAGEVLDIDGITGGFNFQNAWSTGYIAGTSISG
jgi:hypothetical protein